VEPEAKGGMAERDTSMMKSRSEGGARARRQPWMACSTEMCRLAGQVVVTCGMWRAEMDGV
jgi:hypothetical protein